MVEPTMSQDKATRLSEIATKYGDSILRTCFLYLNNMTLAEDALLDGEKRVVVDGYGIVPLSEPNEYMMEVQNTTSNFIPSKVEVTLDEQSYFFDLNIFLLSW